MQLLSDNPAAFGQTKTGGVFDETKKRMDKRTPL